MSKKRTDPISVVVSVVLLVAVLYSVVGSNSGTDASGSILLNDFRSFFFVVGGTFACLLFQFDMSTFLQTVILTMRSFFSNSAKETVELIDELDEAVINGSSLTSLRSGDEITGELLNDIVHMVNEKLFYDEIEGFVTNKVAGVFLGRKVAVTLLNKGAKIAPALGLLGTVIGLIEVLQSLDDPSKIGAAMALALMTTAFGSVLGSLVFTPIAGRLEHHNTIFIETHKLLMNRIKVLMQREERRLSPVFVNKSIGSSA